MISSKITTFVWSIKRAGSYEQKNVFQMKSNEFIRLIKKKGWQFLRQGKGSHEIYEKNGKTVSVPNHGAKELGKGLEGKLRKQMGL